jgi:hypothetical protein
MSAINFSVFEKIVSGELVLQSDCILTVRDTESSFDHNKFVEDYSHDMCTILTFWLHEKYDLKVGAILAINQDDEDDIDYDTIAHQYVYIGDHFILDARGISTERGMLEYYKEASVHDDEEWDLIIESNYEHDASRKGMRDFSEHEHLFTKFLVLLNIKLESLLENGDIIEPRVASSMMP